MKQILILIGFIFCLVQLSGQMKPEDTEVWEPIPKVVIPATGNLPPSDAVVLFNGKDLSQWQNESGEPAGWEVKNGVMTVVPGSGSIKTKHSFGNCQLHIEWRTPAKVVGESQGRGNSGVFLMGNYEVQVLDSYNNRTYSNGQAGSIYKDKIPLVNACRPPGEWQSYDIIFMAPVFSNEGNLLKKARITILQNGILIQNNVEIEGTTDFIGYHSYKPHPPKLPLGLQDHGNPVSFRNIWIRNL